MGIYEEKKRLRNELKQQRESLSKDEWRKRSTAIIDQILDYEPFKQAETIHVFISDEARREVDTIPLLEKTIHSQKKLLAPVVRGNELISVEMTSLKTVRRSSFGILEPIEEMPSSLESEINIVITPLLAVDMAGNRLGYGKGYYDRFFKRLPQSALKLGVAFDFQILQQIPTSKTDVKLDAVATESKILYFQ